jgi:hypothetical protein
VYFKKCADKDKEESPFSRLSHLSSVRCFQSPIKILEENTITITHLFHTMSKLKVKLGQRNKGKYMLVQQERHNLGNLIQPQLFHT